MGEPYFKVRTPLGIEVRTTTAYWEEIVTFKHPVMRGKESLVRETLENPLEIRRSQKDPAVHLYYGADPPYYICVVVKHLKEEGLIITTYRTDVIKEGEHVWPL